MPLWHHGAPEWLPCGHSFHDECLEEYRNALKISKRDIKCPHCKATPTQMEKVAKGLVGKPAPEAEPLGKIAKDLVDQPATNAPTPDVPAQPAQVIDVEETQLETLACAEPTLSAVAPPAVVEALSSCTSSSAAAPPAVVESIATPGASSSAAAPPAGVEEILPPDVVAAIVQADEEEANVKAAVEAIEKAEQTAPQMPEIYGCGGLKTCAGTCAGKCPVVSWKPPLSAPSHVTGCGGPGICAHKCQGKCPVANYDPPQDSLALVSGQDQGARGRNIVVIVRSVARTSVQTTVAGLSHAFRCDGTARTAGVSTKQSRGHLVRSTSSGTCRQTG